MSDIQVVIVNKKSEDKSEQNQTEIQKTIASMKTTNNLLNEINFNSTVNRFEYMEELLRKQHDKFVSVMTEAVSKQKQVVKQIKIVHKQLKEIKLPIINYNRVIAQSQDLIKLKKESDKNYKLSTGMLNALAKMESELDQLDKPIRKKIEETNQSILI